ncbi:unnamed protein product [Acanthosepion pharaonis]|uniref:Uncharacterized protein n=1 Tax=Acanthosepion pharaonis TaxID=158019 RepID=A0A812E3Y9_ACAPH|nr:unnamed protein product [Sepia pharaonis]
MHCLNLDRPLSIYLSIYLSISVCSSIYLSLFISIYLSIYLARVIARQLMCKCAQGQQLLLPLPSLTFLLFGCHLKGGNFWDGARQLPPADRAARASETPEQTSLRLSRIASSSAARLSTESAAARTVRLSSAASTISARRARLSVEERSLQNSQDARG